MKLRTIRTTRAVLASLAVLSNAAWGGPSGKELLDALRSGDELLIQRLVKAGAPVNAEDEFACSALMYASLYDEAHVVRLLLDH
jgi:ankyrin repeat protein